MNYLMQTVAALMGEGATFTLLVNGNTYTVSSDTDPVPSEAKILAAQPAVEAAFDAAVADKVAADAQAMADLVNVSQAVADALGSAINTPVAYPVLAHEEANIDGDLHYVVDYVEPGIV